LDVASVVYEAAAEGLPAEICRDEN
jgi:hypothetical protein